MQRSTQRESFPFDKMIPFKMLRYMVSTAKKVYKRMHKKKQREHNRKLTKSYGE